MQVVYSNQFKHVNPILIDRGNNVGVGLKFDDACRKALTTVGILHRYIYILSFVGFVRDVIFLSRKWLFYRA
jgi:hypothetical protein